MTADKATPRPWVTRLEKYPDNVQEWCIESPAENAEWPEVTAIIVDPLSPGLAKANASLIVTAVNQHDSLLAIKRAAEDYFATIDDETLGSNGLAVSKCEHKLRAAIEAAEKAGV